MTPDTGPVRVIEEEETTEIQSTPPDDDSEVLDVSHDAPEAPPAPRKRRRFRLRRFAAVGLGVWIGLLLTAAGFGLLAFTWAQTAALLDVSAQIPYLVSGGLVGLGLILVGLLVINLSVKRREATDRRRQLEEVREALVRLRTTISEDEPEDEA